MTHILFLNKCWGVDFMLMRRLEREKIEFDYVSLVDGSDDDKKLYTKYGVRSTPCLLVLDKEEIADTLKSMDEIVEFLKNEQNN